MPAPDPASATARQTARQTAEFLLDLRGAATGRGHRRSFAALSGIDVPSVERWVLHAVPGRALVPVSQLAADVGSELPVLSRACASLESQGLVVRLRDPRDGRRTLVGLTDPAHRAIERWNESWPTPYRAAARGWTPQQQTTLRDWVRLVLDTWPDAERAGGAPVGAAPAARSGEQSGLLGAVVALVVTAGRSDLIGASPAAQNLSPALVRALRTVAAHSQPLSVADLAIAGDVDDSLARRRVRHLVDAGLVRRVEAARALEPTAAGRAAIAEIVDARAALLPEVPPRLLDDGLHDLLGDYIGALRRPD